MGNTDTLKISGLYHKKVKFPSNIADQALQLKFQHRSKSSLSLT